MTLYHACSPKLSGGYTNMVRWAGSLPFEVEVMRGKGEKGWVRRREGRERAKALSLFLLFYHKSFFYIFFCVFILPLYFFIIILHNISFIFFLFLYILNIKSKKCSKGPFHPWNEELSLYYHYLQFAPLNF